MGGKSVKADRATAQRLSSLEHRLEEEMRRCKELEAILEIQMSTRASLASSKSNKSKNPAKDTQERRSKDTQERRSKDTGDHRDSNKRCKGEEALAKRLNAEKKLSQEVNAVSKIQQNWRDHHPHQDKLVIEVNVVPPSKEKDRRDRSASRDRYRDRDRDDSEKEVDERRSRKSKKD